LSVSLPPHLGAPPPPQPTAVGPGSIRPHRIHLKLHQAKAPEIEQGSPLIGVFSIAAGNCSSGTPTGTYFRMIQPGGTLNGPFLSNGNSPCATQTYTPLSPGTAGGLSTVGYQPNPSPAFDGSGNGLANTITQPQNFFGVNFSLSTNSTDPQTGLGVAVPSVSNSGGTLSGSLEAISVAWNKQNFNQGSPKPGGSAPGLTTVPTGTYDASTGAFTLSWTSAIVGGPFNNFTGMWHLVGTFIPNSSTPPPTTTTTSPTSSSTTLATASQTGSSTTSSTTTAVAGAQNGGGTSDGQSGTSGTLAQTGVPEDTRNLLLAALVLVVSGLGLLLAHWTTRRSRRRRIAR
jgi:hypothetical protein